MICDLAACNPARPYMLIASISSGGFRAGPTLSRAPIPFAASWRGGAALAAANATRGMASPPAGGGTSAAPWCWEASARAAERILPPLAGGAAAPARGAVPVTAAPAASARGALESLPPAARRWAEACGAKWGGKSGELLLVPGPEVGVLKGGARCGLRTPCRRPARGARMGAAARARAGAGASAGRARGGSPTLAAAPPAWCAGFPRARAPGHGRPHRCLGLCGAEQAAAGGRQRRQQQRRRRRGRRGVHN